MMSESKGKTRDSLAEPLFFGPSVSLILSFVVPFILVVSYAWYRESASLFLLVSGIGLFVYTCVLAANFPFIKLTADEMTIRYLMPLRRGQRFQWSQVERFATGRSRQEQPEPFDFYLQLKSGDSIWIFGRCVRHAAALEQEILKRLPAETVVERSVRGVPIRVEDEPDAQAR